VPSDGDPSPSSRDDEPEDVPSAPLTAAKWHVDRTMIVAKVIAVIAFAAVPQVFQLNSASRWFGLIVAATLAAYAVRDVIAPVRLAADPDGLTVIRGYAGHRRLAWSEVERLRVDRKRSSMLEVEAAESLHLFSRYDLSMPPDEALTMLEQIRP
jgi:Bacterial PH domain